MTSNWTRIAAALGLLGVALGAFGAHGLEGSAEQLEWWKTAAFYHLIHVAPLLVLDTRTGRRGVSFAGFAFCLGIALFSGTLYAMGLGAPRWFGAITPLGGVALMAGWGALFYASSAGRATREQKAE